MRFHRLLDFALLVTTLAVPAQQHRHDDNYKVEDHHHKHEGTKRKRQCCDNLNQPGIYDYIVVGSGAGGGPVACRLARAGFSVLLIEAGTDTSGYQDVQVPSFHPRASELPRQLWAYFVERYEDPAQQLRDTKQVYLVPDDPSYFGAPFTGAGHCPPDPWGITQLLPNGRYYTGQYPPPGATRLGLLYARGYALGGSTQMSAMAMVTPHEEDWVGLGEITGNYSTFDPHMMREYFVKLENCKYIPNSVLGHGFTGWLDISATPLTLVLRDLKLASLIAATALAVGKAGGFLTQLITSVSVFANILAADLNAPGLSRDYASDVWQVPSAVSPDRHSIRSGVIDLIRSTVQEGYPLYVQLDTMVTKVLMDTSGPMPRAYGVQYEYGPNLAYMSTLSTKQHGIPGYAYARYDVILSGGVFETPKLLKLSGIGPAEELSYWGIPVIANLPGVGTNMQDRYELGSVGLATTPFAAFKDCRYSVEPDPCLDEYRAGTNPVEQGPYVSNGLAVGTTLSTSVNDGPTPDIFIVAVPAYFAGYYPGYATCATLDALHWTFVILKMKSRNNAGYVRLRSLDPLDQAEIQFNNFAIGGDLDAQAVAEGIQRAREIYSSVIPLDGTLTEVVPGLEYQGAALIQYIRDNAWGHHACCTARLGAYGDPFAVVDFDFRVMGVSGLRIVDGSVWAKGIGYYPTVPLYMLSERAADVILGQQSVPLGLNDLNNFEAGGPIGTFAAALLGTAGLGGPPEANQPGGLINGLKGILGKRWNAFGPAASKQ
ncbi:hypothetical protein CBER1_07850 [Cercospora berteroae]|uniref:Glucose-methanol-choline oxidoreductase N-terminal domain-containing protein n=1 Tax=Cercospora berteroae TaxID=357750 RepID=A0A2S6C540_9PEZI|nr:hypothetical protein CBER1_07850 [Cercospora berteroae]